MQVYSCRSIHAIYAGQVMQERLKDQSDQAEFKDQAELTDQAEHADQAEFKDQAELTDQAEHADQTEPVEDKLNLR